MPGMSETNLKCKIHGTRGEPIIIPPRLFCKGRSWVSAFIHENSPIHIWMDCKPCLIDQKYDTFQSVSKAAPEEFSPSLQFLWALFHTDDWFPQDKSTSLSDCKKLDEFITNMDVSLTHRSDMDFLSKKAAELGGEQHLPGLLLAIEKQRTFQSRKSAVLEEQKYYIRDQQQNYSEKVLNQDQLGPDLNRLIKNLVQERMRQIEGMISAMNNFLENTN